MKKLVLTPALVCLLALVGRTAAPDSGSFDKKLVGDQQIVHALDRLTFGPRAGDVEAIRKTGLKQWLDQQLHPERIAENPALASKLAPLESLRMTSAESVRAYPPAQLLRAIAQGKQAFPNNPALGSAVQRAAEKLKTREGDPRAQTPQERVPKSQPLTEFLEPAQIRALRTGTPQEQAAVLTSIPDDKLDDVIVRLPQQARQQLMAAAAPPVRRKLLMATAPGRIPEFDLTEAKLDRAVYSNRQLEEQMVDFWFNHFNVYLDKGADRVLTSAYERDAIRPRVFGKFRDLLEATAKSPAMLFYLDNWQSATPQANAQANVRAKGKGKQAARGLNENYARELMELHTLGVDGGYTQKDVTEVARCFTGWTIQQPRLGGDFFFNPRMHDRGEKTVLGVKIPAGGGQEDAERVLDILAKHPSTARFISTKLAQKFVADNPPPVLIERMAKTFRETDGDIRRVMEAMIESPEFFSEGAWQAKVKTPLEMVVSAVRATGAEVNFTVPLAQQIAGMGQPLYKKVEPTGYSSANAEWVNSAALVARMNFGLALVTNRLPGTKVDSSALSGEPGDVASRLLFREPSRESLAAMEKALASDGELSDVGLVLGSPEFQRR